MYQSLGWELGPQDRVRQGASPADPELMSPELYIDGSGSSCQEQLVSQQGPK